VRPALLRAVDTHELALRMRQHVFEQAADDPLWTHDSHSL